VLAKSTEGDARKISQSCRPAGTLLRGEYRIDGVIRTGGHGARVRFRPPRAPSSSGGAGAQSIAARYSVRLALGRISRLCWCSAVVVSSALTWQSRALAEPPTAPPVVDALATEGLPSGNSSSPESPSAPSPAPLSTVLEGNAKVDYDAGRLLYDSGDFAGALLKFQSAYQAAGDPRLLWNAAACERNLRHYANAILLVRRFLASNSPLITPDATSRARAFLDAAEPLTAPLEIESNQPNLQVYLDDQLLGSSELVSGTRVDLGTHRIVVEAPGFARYTETLTVTSSAALRVRAVLQPVTVPMPVFPSSPHKDVPAPPAHSSAFPGWLWVAGGCVVLAGVATASYFIVKPPAAPEPTPGSIGTLRW
jgi:PEGA domain